MNKPTEFNFKTFTWAHSASIDKKMIEEIGKRFKLHKDDLKDIPPPIGRPKLVVRDNYIFMILMYPFYNNQTKLVEISEVDFFVSADFVVTFNDSNKLKPIADLLKLCEKNREAREKIIADGPVGLLYEFLDRLSNFCFPMLIHISNDIDAIEKRLFKEYEKGTIYEILRIKTNIANFSKAIQGHKTNIGKLINNAPPFLPAEKLKVYFQNLAERKGEMWDMVDNLTHIINALHQTNESLISFRINEIMKTLTIFSVIVFPLTLLASIFGMNTVNGMPFAETTNGFWIIIGIMILSVSGMLLFFKRKKWL